MSYEVRDIVDDLKRRWREIRENHLFQGAFAVFVVIFGTSGMWVEPILVAEEISWIDLPNHFNTMSLVTFCAPVFFVTVFDSVLRIAAKYKDDKNSIDPDLLVWQALMTFVMLAATFILFVLGSKQGNHFSVYSLIATIFVLCYWALVNISNPSYKSSGTSKAAVGTDNVDDLMDGAK